MPIFLIVYALSFILSVIMSHQIGIVSMKIKLTHLIIEMMKEDEEYLDSLKSRLTLEERESFFNSLEGKISVYRRLDEEFQLTPLDFRRKVETK